MAFTDRLHNRGSISTGYEIENSAAFGGANGIQFNPSSDGNRRTWTVSLWLKRSEISVETTIFGAQNTAMVLMDPDWFRFTLYTGSTTYYFDTENGGPVYKDTNAWYNFVFQCDTTQGTAANRAKLWVNGEAVTNTNSNVIPQNTEFQLNNNTVNFNIGYFYAGGEQLDGYLADVHFTDGVANDPTEFGEFDEDSGIWKPKAYTGSYGTNGFYLEFKEPAASATGIGKDTSGNGHNFSTGGTYPSQATDTPTNNFSTFNVLHPYSSASNHNPTFTEGATRFTTLLPGYWEAAVASMGITSGKWYFEAQPGTSTSHITSIGYGDESDIHDWGQDIADTNGFIGEGGTNSIGYLGSDTSSSYGNIWLGTGSTSNVNANYTISNIVGVAIDADNGYVYFARDNTYVNSGDPGSGASGTGGYTFQDTTTPRTGTVFPAVAGYYHTAATVININFGGYTTISISSAETDENGYGTFEYAPPSGYYALCTKNLAEYG